MAGFVVWFTGLSGSGKSTLGRLLSQELSARQLHVEVLDGDLVREHLSKGLGFSREDRDTNVRRIGFVAKLLAGTGACVITAAISPYRSVRDEQRAAIGRFVEVYCKCSIDELAERDPKGLYKKALRGELPHFTGVSDPYEAPEAPEIVLDTGASSIADCLAQLLSKLEELGLLSRGSSGAGVGPAWGGQLVAPPPSSSPSRNAGAQRAELRVQGTAARLARLAAFGVLSPIIGPLGEKDAHKVEKEGRLESALAWPVPFVIPCETEPTAGSRLLLVTGDEEPLELVVRGTWRDESGRGFVQGELTATPPGALRALRERLHTQGFGRAAGFLVRRPLDAADELLLSIGLEARGKIALYIGGGEQAAHASVKALIAARGLHDVALVADVPPLPVLSPERDPLFVAVLLTNLGPTGALLDAPHGEAAIEPRSALERWLPSEIPIEIVAAGPVVRAPDGALVTRRMSPRPPLSAG